MNADRKQTSVCDDLTLQYMAVAEAACDRLAKNQQVRRNLPGGGRLRVDRQLPFLCLYRGQQGDSGTRELITTSAAYVYAPADEQHLAGLSLLCAEICAAMQEYFGTFLVIEVWEANEAHRGFSTPIEFDIVGVENVAAATTIKALEKALKSIRVGGHIARVRRVCEDFVSARGLPSPFAGSEHCTAAACCTLGLRVSPIYRDPTSGTLYPVMLQGLRWKLATALRKTIAHFTGNPRGPERKRTHHDTFGPSSMVKATRIVDQKLSEVAESFDFILQVTPMNSGEVWECLNRKRWQDLPQLCYRPLPYHPNLLKRKLFGIEIERVEDPTLAHLFWEKQDEVDRRLTALRDLHAGELTLQNPRQQTNFLTTSLQLYGAAEDELLALAHQILKRFPPRLRKFATLNRGFSTCLLRRLLRLAVRKSTTTNRR